MSQCDYSLTSHVTRFFEGTETKAAVLAELAAAFPETVTFTPQTIPTHAKYFIFQRRDAADSAVFGGVNIGDRFASWRWTPHDPFDPHPLCPGTATSALSAGLSSS